MATSKALTVAHQGDIQVSSAFGEMTVQTIVDRKRKIVEVLEAVMKEGEHYGRIPGTGTKPSLFKAGAEVLATTFGLAPTFKIERTDLPGGHREYEITCTLVHIATGAIVGEGVGCCSTMESKYRWRKAERSCPKCNKQGTVLKSKNESEGYFCWRKKDGCGATFPPGDKSIEGQEVGRVENPDIADTWNTVLKMAKKRAQVDCTLTAVGASDLLTQDLEDLPPGSRDIAPQQNPADADIEPPRTPSNGRTGTGQQSRGQAQPPSEDPQLEAQAMDLIVEIRDCRTPDEVRKLAPKFNALPKGTRARESAYVAYQKQLAALQESAA